MLNKDSLFVLLWFRVFCKLFFSFGGKVAVPEVFVFRFVLLFVFWATAAFPVRANESALWGKTPKIAVVIDDLGLNKKATEAVIRLPAPLTLSFMAYADDLDDVTERAATAGHELFLHVPMEPVGSAYPGAGALRAAMSDNELRGALDVALSAFSGYVGINNHMGSLLTADRRAMDVVAGELKPRNLIFLDSLTSPSSVAATAAAAAGLRYAVRDVFLDHVQRRKEILENLRQLEHKAERNGFAVGIGHPHPLTIAILKEWIPEALRRGFDFVPVSAIAHTTDAVYP